MVRVNRSKVDAINVRVTLNLVYLIFKIRQEHDYLLVSRHLKVKQNLGQKRSEVVIVLKVQVVSLYSLIAAQEVGH